MFNSREYEWADITVVMGGRNITGLRGIKYNIKREKELLHAKGNKPHSVQRGNYDYSGEISLVQSEYLALREAAKGDAMTTDILIGVEFTEDNTEWKQGDKNLEKAIPFIFLNKKQA